ncbi:MAG TPA: arginase [Clostridiales bacterium]|nr:arginase [Clostridiales bacterium]
MEKCLLSVDWDYFIYTKEYWGSYLENNRSINDLWYKRYIQAKVRGEDIIKAFCLSPKAETFWAKIKNHFKFEENTKVFVSDSHALSHKIAIENSCKVVFLFDAHADLGYGGPASLNFEVNSSNWLGKLLKEKQIKQANIFYSPHTSEKPEYFNWVNNIYDIRYLDINNFDKCVVVSVIHLCRSGAWTPPWLDDKFIRFVNSLGIPYKIIDCPKRKWDPHNISLSDQINYLMA